MLIEMIKSLYIKILTVFLISFISLSAQNGDEFTAEQYVEKYKDIAIKEMYEFRVPASITLAQGILESGKGSSQLAKEANNHFGIKCHKEWTGKTFYMDDDVKNECFRKYNTAEESFRDHSYFLSTRDRYSELFKLDIKDYKAWAHGLKKAGYATNPKYAHSLIRIIEEHKLYIFDQDNYEELARKETGKENKKIRDVKSENSEDFEPISISGTNRKIYENNGIKFIRARKNDNFRKIADDMEMVDWQLARYNEMKKDKILKQDQIIYLQPKKRKASKEYHIVKPHETMHSISQLYGIKLKQLYKKNNMTPRTIPEAGQKLWLRKRKK